MNRTLFLTALFCILFLVHPLFLLAQNPIVPPGIYMADPTARVWDDGRLYIYGSVDESTDYYCSHRYHVLSTSDLVNWTLHENSFSSMGEDDRVPYSDELLYAPDCQVKGDTFYLYYCQPDRDHAEGVAVSTRPTGPFEKASIIDVSEHNQIDPCVFIDDDGQAYYMWGQFTAKMARLNPDMRTLDTTTIRDSVLTEGEHFFHEGGHMIKRNGIYYFLYAHLGRAAMPTCIGYATSRSPMGPFTYGGVIVDNDHCDPGNWNNHGSIMEFNGQWYVFYHRATHNSKMMRKACMEPIFFNEDGSIDEVEMTSQGAGGPLPATSVIDAGRACLLHGNVRIRACAADNEELAGIRDGDRAVFRYVDFGDGVDSVSVRVKPGKHSGRIDLKAGMPWGTSVGSVEVPDSTCHGGWVTLTSPTQEVRGVKVLWLVFSGEGDELFSVDWIQFNGTLQSRPPAGAPGPAGNH
ncbi:MAG TPA: carbohydrate-binding protein [Bacteroides sp.]|nr:carbohydrate-binding protein [Bacteroides sp.]